MLALGAIIVGSPITSAAITVVQHTVRRVGMDEGTPVQCASFSIPKILHVRLTTLGSVGSAHVIVQILGRAELKAGVLGVMPNTPNSIWELSWGTEHQQWIDECMQSFFS